MFLFLLSVVLKMYYAPLTANDKRL